MVEKDPSLLLADSEVSDQAGRMPRLICVFAGRTSHFVVLFDGSFISEDNRKCNNKETQEFPRQSKKGR